MIDIAIIHYNQPEYLERAIASALKQTVPVRVTVYDDCSPCTILRKPNVRYVFREKNSGNALWGWKQAVHDAMGEYLIILSADDELIPDACATVLKAGGDWVFGDVELIDADSNPCGYWSYEDWPHNPEEGLELTVASHSLGVTMLAAFRVGFLRENDLRPTRFPNMTECLDTATGMEWMAANPRMTYLPRPLFRYRKYEGSETASIDRALLASEIETLAGRLWR